MLAAACCRGPSRAKGELNYAAQGAMYHLLFCAELPAPCSSHQGRAVCRRGAGSCAQLAERC
jgi:hypothetical protein